MPTFLWHPLTPKCTWLSQKKSKKNSQKILENFFHNYAFFYMQGVGIFTEITVHPKIIRLVSLPTVNLPPRCHYNINFLRTRPSHRCRLDLLSHHAGCVRSWTTVHLAFFTLLSRIWSGQAPDPRSTQADARTWPYDRWQFYPSCSKVVFKLSQSCLQVAR